MDSNLLKPNLLAYERRYRPNFAMTESLFA